MAYCILKFTKLKDIKSLASHYSHYTDFVKISQDDRDGEMLDSVSVAVPCDDIVAAWRRFLASLKYYSTHEFRKNGVMAYDIRLGYSKEAAEWLDAEKWKTLNLKWLQKTFGSGSVLSLVFHSVLINERKVLHGHAIVVPVAPTGKINARHYTGNKFQLSAMQDSYGKAMSETGLKRGLKYNTGKQDPPLNYYAEPTDLVFGISFKRREDCRSDDEYIEEIRKAWKIERAAHQRELDLRKNRLYNEKLRNSKEERTRALILKRERQIRQKEADQGAYLSGFSDFDEFTETALLMKDLESALINCPDEELCRETRSLIKAMNSE